jgi:hypothetical protein
VLVLARFSLVYKVVGLYSFKSAGHRNAKIRISIVLPSSCTYTCTPVKPNDLKQMLLRFMQAGVGGHWLKYALFLAVASFRVGVVLLGAFPGANAAHAPIFSKIVRKQPARRNMSSIWTLGGGSGGTRRQLVDPYVQVDGGD